MTNPSVGRPSLPALLLRLLAPWRARGRTGRGARSEPPPRRDAGPGDEAFLQSLADNLPVSMYVLGADDGRLLRVNRNAARELGLEPAQLVGRTVAEVFGADLAQRLEPVMRRTLDTGEPVETEFAVSMHGDERLVNARFVAIRRDDRPTRVWVIVRDVTNERRAQRELADSKALFDEFAGTVDDGVFITNIGRRRFYYVSSRALDIWGTTPERIAADPGHLLSLVHVDDRHIFLERGDREARLEAVDVQFRIHHPTRGLRWLRSRTRAGGLREGEPSVYGLISDVTAEHEREDELHRAREVAEAASRAKSQFMANMSHEIRTPMNGILGMTELLLGTPLSDRQQRFAQAVYRSGESLLEIINDILDFSKVEAGKLELAPCDFSLRAVLEDTLELLAPRAHEKRIELTLREAPGLPVRVHGDPLRLRQVLTNLVANAIKFTEVGEVVVDLRRVEPPPSVAGVHGDRAWIEIEVRDTGVGIVPDVLPRLFTSFEQVHGGMSRRYGGTGLGLAISRQLVELMGGRIEVESRPGMGSCFRVALPLQPAGDGPNAVEAEFPPPLPMATDSNEGDGLTAPLRGHILVVEDNAVNQEVIGQMLRRLGCRVRVANGAMDGLRALCEERFDLVLMDIQMPGMDGTEALHWFRRGPDPRFEFVTPSHTPVIAVTANALGGDAQRYLGLGFDEYLSKPFRQSQLHTMLKRRLPQAPADGPAPGGAPAPAAAPDAFAALTTVLDAQALARLRELDPSGANGLLPRVLQAFETSLHRLLGQLEDARVNNDHEAMRHVAHTLKSSSASVGALELSRICADIERRVREQQTEGLPALLDDMVAQCDRVRAVLKPVLSAQS